MSVRINAPSGSQPSAASLSPLTSFSHFTTLHPHWGFLCSLNTQVYPLLLSTGASLHPDFCCPSISHGVVSSSSAFSWPLSWCICPISSLILLFSAEQLLLSGHFLLFIISPLSTLHSTHSHREYKLSKVRDFISTHSMRACTRCRHNQGQR